MKDVVSGTEVQTHLVVTDEDGDQLIYRWIQTPSQPEGSFSDTAGREPNWIAPEVTQPTSFLLKVSIQDGEGSSLVSWTGLEPSAFMTTSIQSPSAGTQLSCCVPGPEACAVQKSCSVGGPDGALPGSSRGTDASRPRSSITVRGGARARGVGIGSKIPAILARFPNATVDHSTDQVFQLTLVVTPKRKNGHRIMFGVSTQTKRTTLIGVPGMADGYPPRSSSPSA